MGVVQIPVSSVTYAVKGQRLLSGEGIRSRIERTPRRMSDKGCGYSLAVSEDKAEASESILRKNGIKINGRRNGQ